MKIKYCLLVLGFMLFCSGIMAQTTFPMEHKGSHFFFTANIDGEPAEIMLESGLPAFLVGVNFYEQHLKDVGLAFEPSKADITLFNEHYKISFRAEGKMHVGAAIYDGPVFVLEDFDDLRMPIQFLQDGNTGKGIVKVDLPNGCLLVGEECLDKTAHFQKYKLSYSTMGMPVINATLRLKTAKGNAKLKGDFMVDFGNPMLLFLMRQHKSLDKAVKKGRIELKDAYDNKGVLVAQGIYAEKASFCGREYNNVSFGVTDKMPTFEQLGLIGLPFYDSPVVFDFDKKVMMILK